MPKGRADVLAYKQGFSETREQAKCGVMVGLVVNMVNGERYDKPGEKTDDGAELKLKGEKLKYVSRGGLKLEKALQVSEISVDGQTTIDIGASTGGFTDVMLQNGAKLVYAVDVGTNQLVQKLHQDECVRSMEQHSSRYTELADSTEGQPTFASIDTSFISLNLILPALHNILADNGQAVALTKLQFEAGREQTGKNGIARDRVVHQKVLENVTDFVLNYGLTVKGLDFSPTQGGHGNIEFLVHLERLADAQNLVTAMIPKTVEKAHEEFKDEKG